jgi:thiamine biosynthesis lipoprotein
MTFAPLRTSTDDLIRRAEPVMGTVVSIHVRPGPVPVDEVYLALAEARSRLQRADAVFSTWKPLSPVNRIRRSEITVDQAPGEVAEVLGRCAEAKERSGGWFDPWRMPGGWDPTGLVKGWAAAKALDALIDAGVAAAMVNAGGDAALHGRRSDARPWRMGVQDPADRSVLAVVAEPVSAIATSGVYERGWHVFDPFSGEPTAAVASATVTGPDLALADAFATALVAGGDDALDAIRGRPGYEALLIGHDGRRRATSGFPLAPHSTHS